MIDLKAARQEPDRFRAALARRGAAEDFDALLACDQEWRQAAAHADDLRAKQKTLSTRTPSEHEIAQLKSLKAELAEATKARAEAEERRTELLAKVPNLPDPTAADGMAEEDAELIREQGERPDFPFEPKDHLELGSAAGWVDMARGARLAGSRFAYRFGDIARTEMALYRFVLDRLIDKGFMPVLAPTLVNEQAMYGTGFLPTEETNIYRVERDDMYLTGTSEVALAGIHMGELLEREQLPLCYAAFSTNYRREAGAAGKDTRGMFRVHQFDKVEMFVFCLPEDSREWHEKILTYEEEIVRDLGLPYRVMNIAVGDLGSSASKKYDIEAWFPVQGRYREITSCSNTTDYQARRLKIRYRNGDATEYVHTLNGTGVTARALLSIMENLQDESGQVTVPEVLHPYGAPKTLGSD